MRIVMVVMRASPFTASSHVFMSDESSRAVAMHTKLYVCSDIHLPMLARWNFRKIHGVLFLPSAQPP